MNLGSEWVVELAAREKQAREQQCWLHARPENGTGPVIAANGFGRRCLRDVADVLLAVGAWLDRKSGEAPRAYRTIEGLTNRNVDPDAPSWT